MSEEQNEVTHTNLFAMLFITQFLHCLAVEFLLHVKRIRNFSELSTRM